MKQVFKVRPNLNVNETLQFSASGDVCSFHQLNEELHIRRKCVKSTWQHPRYVGAALQERRGAATWHQHSATGHEPATYISQTLILPIIRVRKKMRPHISPPDMLCGPEISYYNFYNGPCLIISFPLHNNTHEFFSVN